MREDGAPRARGREPAGAAPPDPSVTYQIAGLRFGSDLTLPHLEPFREEPGPELRGEIACSLVRGFWRAETASVRAREPLTGIYRGSGWIGGRSRRVALVAGRDALYLMVHPGGRYRIAADGSRVVVARSVPEAAREEEILLGPCLVLSLALHGLFCLHASAVTRDGTSAVAFLGDSGAGKSTLAAFLGSRTGRWRRLADDLLPVDPSGAAHPRFPQLKLTEDEQWTGIESQVGGLPLAAFCFPHLADPSGPPLSEPRLRPLPKVEAVSRLIRHTVASRLFPSALLARHLVACSQLAQWIPAFQLDLPRDLARLEETEELLRALHSSLPERPSAGQGGLVH